jgi:hypothetical protein
MNMENSSTNPVVERTGILAPTWLDHTVARVRALAAVFIPERGGGILARRTLPTALLLTILSIAILACNAGSAIPALFATQTYTPTATSTPSPSPTPTLTPTLRPTATAVPTGVELRQQAGGATLFVDYDGGYQILFSDDWALVKISGDELQTAFSEAGEANPGLVDLLEIAKNLDPEMFRLLAYSRVLPPSKYLTNINVTMVRGGVPASMPLDILMQATVETMKDQLPGTIITAGDVKTNGNGIEIGTLEVAQLSMQLPNGGQVLLYEKQLYFQRENALVVITLAAPKDKQEEISTYFDEISEAIAPIG